MGEGENVVGLRRPGARGMGRPIFFLIEGSVLPGAVPIALNGVSACCRQPVVFELDGFAPRVGFAETVL